MRTVTLVLGVCLLAGCQTGEPPQPPTAPPPEDLSTWATPALQQLLPRRKPLPPVVEEKPGKAEKVEKFEPGTTYPVRVEVGTPFDLVFERGEQVRNIVDSDRAPRPEGHPAPWSYSEGKDGDTSALRPHVFITVSEAGLTNGLTVTTDRRVYYLTLSSVKQTPTRVLRWTYAPPPVDVVVHEDEPPGLLPDPNTPRQYHVGYTLSTPTNRPPDWQPRHVVDDGAKLYIVYPEVTLFSTVPMVRMIGPNGPQLVNSRQVLNVVVVDQLAPRLELRAGIGETAEIVQVTRGQLRTIQCPQSPDCPLWPAAAQHLAGR